MTVRHHYDASGNYRGKSTTEPHGLLQWLVTSAMCVLALYFGARWLWETLNGYAALAFPYKHLVGWYHLIIVLPINAASAASDWVSKATQWPNLNSVLRVALFAVAYLLPYAAVGLVLRRIRWGAVLATVAVFGPLLLMGLWVVASSALGWLFATP